MECWVNWLPGGHCILLAPSTYMWQMAVHLVCIKSKQSERKHQTAPAKLEMYPNFHAFFFISGISSAPQLDPLALSSWRPKHREQTCGKKRKMLQAEKKRMLGKLSLTDKQFCSITRLVGWLLKMRNQEHHRGTEQLNSLFCVFFVLCVPFYRVSSFSHFKETSTVTRRGQWWVASNAVSVQLISLRWPNQLWARQKSVSGTLLASGSLSVCACQSWQWLAPALP